MSLIIFDGDDTLWDTSSIFVTAQLLALEKISKLCGNIDPNEEYKTLRMFDDRLIQLNNKSEYDFTMLFLSLIKHYKENKDINSTIKKSIKIIKSTEPNMDKEESGKINNDFLINLKIIPRLYPDTIYTLEKTIEKGFINILISEGGEERIKQVLNYYNLWDFFNNAYMFRKNPESYKKIVSDLINLYSIKNNEIIVVGDLLDRDIYYGNMVNATTIHKPGGYKPNQKPKNKFEFPDYTIKNISDLLSII